jgi:hypothetical protein
MIRIMNNRSHKPEGRRIAPEIFSCDVLLDVLHSRLVGDALMSPTPVLSSYGMNFEQTPELPCIVD